MPLLTDRQADVLDHAMKRINQFGSFRPRPNERSLARKLERKGLLQFMQLDAHGMAEYGLTQVGEALRED